MAHLIKMYKFIVGTESKFTDALDASTQEAGEEYWHTLDKACLVLFLAMLIITIGLCVLYFTYYNNRPGRHYRVSHWVRFYVGAITASFVSTWLLSYILATPTVKGAEWLVFDIAIGNLEYSIILFLFMSIIWWRYLPTNAYRVIKRKRS